MSSRPICWNRTYSGITTAIGGRIRCEISQNAMSSLARVRRNRRPMAWASNANTATPDATASCHGTPPSTAPYAPATQTAPSAISPIRGR